MTFHHIGIATKNIEKELKNYGETLNVKSVSDIVYDPIQNARLCMMVLDDGIRMELVEGDPVQEFLKKGVKIYHMCYEVKNIQREIEVMQENKAILVSGPSPAILFNNKKVAFLFSRIGLIELVEV